MRELLSDGALVSGNKLRVMFVAQLRTLAPSALPTWRTLDPLRTCGTSFGDPGVRP